MFRTSLHENATSNVLAWSSHAANLECDADEDAAADADKPPDGKLISRRTSPEFRRTPITKLKENHASLLTRALQSASEGETAESTPARSSPTSSSRRRRSITSEVSVATTADLTSDTGVTTPARTNSPSPRLLSVEFAPLSWKKHPGAPVHIVGSPRNSLPACFVIGDQPSTKPISTLAPQEFAVQTVEKKRCISFACTAKPRDDAVKPLIQPTVPAIDPQPRKSCIKFACPAKPERRDLLQTPFPNERPVIRGTAAVSLSVSSTGSTVSTVRKAWSPAAARRVRPVTPQPTPKSPAISRKKYITASSDELQREDFHFHEFANDQPHEEDWIRRETRENTEGRKKVTLDEILKKENDIRRLGKEVEEEAEQEDAEDQDQDQDDVDEDGWQDGDESTEKQDELVMDEQDAHSGYGSDDDFSDGYHTDEDLGFADSDDEEDDDLDLWTWTAVPTGAIVANFNSVLPFTSSGILSDSSACSVKRVVRRKHIQQRSVTRPLTPELPDSTDFVCGTMDEDRPVEEAYLTRITERKKEKLRVIPQDIDPSFPTSGPDDDDDEGDEDIHSSHDSGEPIWLQGELEGLHEERQDRRRWKTESPPKRMRSPPPPKRYHSPRPKAHGRSPRRVLDRPSPKCIKSAALTAHPNSPAVSLVNAANALAFDDALTARPGLTYTKSLPRGGHFPGHIKTGKRYKSNAATKSATGHMRGAIDIVKGLEQKRQRRKEKFYLKYCDRARKGQIPEKKAKAGEGAERMREVAGKMAQCHFVISI